MLSFFNKSLRITINENDIFINNQNRNIGVSADINYVFNFNSSIPEIRIFEDNNLVRIFTIETLNSNPDLNGQYLHSSIRILPNSAVMIDGIISQRIDQCPRWTDSNYEAIRFQPFYLSNADSYNLALVGKGLFDRGLHFVGTITPSSVRCICICDYCTKSFTTQHFHAGFMDSQYFYSSDGMETLIVPYEKIENMPVQLQKEIDAITLKEVESKLPLPPNNQGSFNYYNPFRCSHCSSSYISFENNNSRPNEYYGNTYINKNPIYWND